MLELDPKTTALVLIDLQKGIMRHELKPYPADRVTKAASTLADTFRKAGAPVVLVNVGFAKDFKDALRQPVDQPFAAPPGGLPENFSELIDGLAKPDDILVTKRQWGAFHGTELDLQLRRRGIQTIVLGGVATNIGVESTARQAWEYGYAVVLAEDATSGMFAEMHDFAIGNIFPRISRVVKSADLTLSQA
jgi:nicotinamidase-related amidase